MNLYKVATFRQIGLQYAGFTLFNFSAAHVEGRLDAKGYGQEGRFR